MFWTGMIRLILLLVFLINLKEKEKKWNWSCLFIYIRLNMMMMRQKIKADTFGHPGKIKLLHKEFLLWWRVVFIANRTGQFTPALLDWSVKPKKQIKPIYSFISRLFAMFFSNKKLRSEHKITTGTHHQSTPAERPWGSPSLPSSRSGKAPQSMSTTATGWFTGGINPSGSRKEISTKLPL